MTKDKPYCVYMHINKKNNKKYVGITSQNPLLRWDNGHGYYRNIHFYSAIKKYGWDGFDHLIVKSDISSEEACELEKKLISKYNSNNPKFGYNITCGGEKNILPYESKRKISKANKGRKITSIMKEKRNKNPPKSVKVICEGKEFVSIAQCAKY